MTHSRRTDRRAFLSSSLVALGALAPPRRGQEASTLAALEPPRGVGDEAWTQFRELFVPDDGVAYLNNASMGMPPEAVAIAVAAGYEAVSRRPLTAKHHLQEQIADVVMPGLATFLGARTEELSLTRNATEALHLQALGVTLQRGDEVLISSQEHPAGRRPWLLRAAREGVQVAEVFVPSPLRSESDAIDAFAAAITSRTRVISFCHVTRGGHVYPVAALAALARRHGLLSLVDGAQAVGMLPVNLAELGCDAYAASLHKWFLGPLGTGFLYVREAARDRIASLFAHDATLAAPALAPPGTLDLPVRAALAPALHLCATVGIDNVERRLRYLSDYFKDRLRDIADVTLLSGPSPATASPGSTIFEIEGVDAAALVPLFDARGLYIDEHQRDGHNAIRVSTHAYNTTGQIDRLAAALSGLGG